MDASESRIYIAIIITVVLLGIIISYFAWTMIRQQRRNMALQKANALAEITAMEKERARIATDLHDDIGPVLSVIKFQVDHVELVDTEEKKEMTKASHQLNNLIIRLREVAHNLMPTALEHKGLVEAVGEFIKQTGAAAGLQVNFTVNGQPELTEEKRINTFRIVQELVHNCIKHAEAKNLDLLFDCTRPQFTIIYQDDGKGFTENKIKAGIGLRSMRNRTEIMGGKLKLESKPGKGTLFVFEIPPR